MYWKQKERECKKWWEKRGHLAERMLFNTGERMGIHCDVKVDNRLNIDVKSTHGKDSITIKRHDCEKITNIDYSIQFSFYGNKKQYTIMRTEDYERLIRNYLFP